MGLKSLNSLINGRLLVRTRFESFALRKVNLDIFVPDLRAWERHIPVNRGLGNGRNSNAASGNHLVSQRRFRM